MRASLFVDRHSRCTLFALVGALTFSICRPSFGRESAPAPLSNGQRDGVATKQVLSTLDFARLLAQAGQYARARQHFLAVWEAVVPPEQRACAAFYLGLLADRDGDAKAAADWYGRAAEISASPEQEGFFRLCRVLARDAGTRQPGPSASPFRFVSFTAQPPSAQGPGGPKSMRDRAVKLKAELGKHRPQHAGETGSQAAWKFVTEARSSPGQNSPGTRIKLMSALTAYAELASRPEESLYVGANECFEDAKKYYNELKETFGKDPTEAEKLCQDNPTVMMRFDFVHVRWAAIQDHVKASNKAQRKRIATLQELVKTYRRCDDQLTSALTYGTLREEAAAEESLAKARELYQQMAGNIRDSGDHYLLTPEPEPDQHDPAKPADPDANEEEAELARQADLLAFSEELGTQVDVVESLLTVENATRSDPADVSRLDQAIALAKPVVDANLGGPVTALAHYVLGRAHEAKALARTTPAPEKRASHDEAEKDFQAAKQYFSKAADLLDPDKANKTRVAIPRSGAVAAGSNRSWSRDWFSPATARDADARTANPFTFASLRGVSPAVNVQPVAWVAEPRAGSPLLTDVRKRLNELNDSSVFLTASRDCTQRGQLAAALGELERGVQRHRSPDLWYAWADTGILWPESDKKTLQARFAEARNSRLVPDNDYRTHLIAGRIRLADVLNQMANGPLERLAEPGIAAIYEQLKTAGGELSEARRIASAAGDQTQRRTREAQCQAYLSLTVACAAIVHKVAGDDFPSLVDGHAQAVEAVRRLVDALRQKGENDPERLACQAALVAARLAHGHLMVRLLKVESAGLGSFSEALDDLAALPAGAPQAKLLGVPLLDALRSHRQASVPPEVLQTVDRIQEERNRKVGDLTSRIGQAAVAVRARENDIDDLRRQIRRAGESHQAALEGIRAEMGQQQAANTRELQRKYLDRVVAIQTEYNQQLATLTARMDEVNSAVRDKERLVDDLVKQIQLAERSHATALGRFQAQIAQQQEATAKERRLRNSLEYFADGAMALHFGDSAGAARQMEVGLQQLTAPQPPPASFNAVALIAPDDPVATQIYLPDLLRAFKVLSLVVQGDQAPLPENRLAYSEQAVAEAVRIAAPDMTAADERWIRAAIERTRTPLSAVALGLALEQRGAATELARPADRSFYMQAARQAFAQANRRWTETLRERYAALAKLGDEGEQRLADSRYYENRIAEARNDDKRLAEAQRLTEQGLARHPSAKSLWDQLLQIALERADVQEILNVGNVTQQYAAVHSILQRMETVSVGTSFERLYWRGYVHERLQDWPQARSSYAQARQVARTDEDRVKVMAKLANANARATGVLPPNTSPN